MGDLTLDDERWYVYDRLNSVVCGRATHLGPPYRPALGDMVVIRGARLRRAWWRACGVVTKITKRRLDKTCRDPVTYWHIRGLDGVVRRWTNITCERVFAGRDVAHLRKMLKA